MAGRILPVLATLVIFAVIFARIPFARFWEALAGARVVPFVAAIGGFALCYFLMDTFVLLKMVRWFHGPLRYRELLPARAVTYLVSIVNTQLAQGALALYIHRRFGTPLAEIAGTVAVLILLEVTQLVLFTTAGFLVFPSSVPASLLAVPAALALFWLLIAVLARNPGGFAGLRLGEGPFFQTLRRARPRHYLTVLALKAPVFVLSLFVHSLALGFFGIHIPLGRLLAFLPIVFMVAALPVTVAHLGTSQAAWVFFFNDFAPEPSLLAYSLAAHLTFMLANGTLGLVFLPKAYAELILAPRSGTDS
jgi:hypothetical protein